MENIMDCPDCNARLSEREPRGDAVRYECPKHGIFRVTRTSETVGFWTAPQNEKVRALKIARAKAPKGNEPIVVY